jgi:hypothetical protein
MRRAPIRRAGGFVAIEFVAGVALLLVPCLLLVAAVPVWSEREHAATVAAREAARYAAEHWPADTTDAATAIAQLEAVNLGVPISDIAVQLDVDDWRGGQARVRVTVVMPAVVVPGIGRRGAWHWTATATLRIDDYRSR